MIDTALLVIDAQQSFRHRDYWVEDEARRYFAEQQRLIDGCAAAGVPVLQIFHVEDSGVFSDASGLVRTIDPLRIDPTATFRKHVHSALVGSGLEDWLRSAGVRRLIVSGIRTEQCCETTTRHASDLGFAVDYVTDATLTFAMRHPSGGLFSAEDIRVRTELVLAGRFATIRTVDEVLGELTPLAA
ncbi:isochorismatase family protein [Sphingomonas tabacisoli]|uniref:Isochorismatase family protein n=1 Tax=Sphingomonas tabacisoli TaxID=2249466 RepID=A0ABW4I293_9SPHN